MFLARAMCAAKKLILLDEPVTGLDPAATGEMYALINELNKKDGMTIIMVTHDIMRSLNYATHILCLCSSKESFFGTAEEYADSHLAAAMMGGGA